MEHDGYTNWSTLSLVFYYGNKTQDTRQASQARFTITININHRFALIALFIMSQWNKTNHKKFYIVKSPKSPSPHWTNTKPSPTQIKTEHIPKGTGADIKIMEWKDME